VTDTPVGGRRRLGRRHPIGIQISQLGFAVVLTDLPGGDQGLIVARASSKPSLLDQVGARLLYPAPTTDLAKRAPRPPSSSALSRGSMPAAGRGQHGSSAQGRG